MSAPNLATAMARTLVDEWARCGVTDAVVAPGSRSTALVLALAERDDLRVHVQVDERSAAFLALGIAKGSGQPALVVTTSGTATANLHPAVAEADRGAVPMLLVTADRPPELRDTDANQTITQVRLYADSLRWQVDLGVAEDREDAVPYWRSTAGRAVAEARGLRGAAGPVHVNAPFREPTVPLEHDGRTPGVPFRHPTDGRPGGAPWIDVAVGSRRVETDRLERLAVELAGRRGVVVAGESGADPDGVHRLGTALGWPVLATAMSGARDRDEAIATYHHLLGVTEWADAHHPEVVLRLGRVGPSTQLMQLLEGPTRQVAVLPDARWSDPRRTTAEVLIGDLSDTCGRLADHAATQRRVSGWWDDWRSADHSARAAIEQVLGSTSSLSEPAVARIVAGAVTNGSQLVVASSMPIRDLDAFMVPRGGIRLHANRGVSGIDGFVSTTLGVALGSATPTIALAGDLSLLHDGNGFLLHPDGDVEPATFVVLNNDGGGIFHFLPQARFPERLERYFATPHGRDLTTFARFHGLEHVAPAGPDELTDAITSSSGLRLVEVRTDRADNVELHRRISAEVASVLG